MAGFLRLFLAGFYLFLWRTFLLRTFLFFVFAFFFLLLFLVAVFLVSKWAFSFSSCFFFYFAAGIFAPYSVFLSYVLPLISSLSYRKKRFISRALEKVDIEATDRIPRSVRVMVLDVLA